MFISFSCTLLCDRLIPHICCCDSHRHISYLTLTCIHLILAMPCLTLDIWQRYLPCISLNIWYRYLPCLSLDIDTGTCHAILIIWYLILVLAMLCLLLDIWYRYLPCYTYYLISDTSTCHAILITWYLILVLAILYLLLDI